MISIVSGYFLVTHVGHVALFTLAKESIPDGEDGTVIAIVNNDHQQVLKYGKVIVPERERIMVVQSNRFVDLVVKAVDIDRTVNQTLENLRAMFPYEHMLFCNGGDVTKENCRELDTCIRLGIRPIFGLGPKIQSSSSLLGSKINMVGEPYGN